MKKTLLVLLGGCSSEYEVSLHSGAAVIRAVARDEYDILQIGITRKGQWLYYNGTADEIEQDIWWQHPSCVPAILSPSREDHGVWLMHEQGAELQPVDVVFPVLHGRNGEDGTLQGLLELAGIPFVGCGCLSSSLCIDKVVSHNLALQAGIKCPQFISINVEGNSITQLEQTVRQQMKGIPFPWFVKPSQEGSSFGISKVENAGQLGPALAVAARYGETIVIEQGISGFEVGCAVLGNRELTTGAIDAISLATGFFDFHEKYNLETAKILVPAPVDAALEQKIRQTAIQLYRLFHCKGFARVDLFINEDNEIIFNEINTIPGLTPHSRYPGMLKQAGITFEAMVHLLLKEAVNT